MNKRQQGFGVVELILIGVLVLIIGFVLWRVYDTQLSIDNTSDTAKQASDQTIVKDKNAGYVVLKDWGVRFKPATGLSVSDVLPYFKKSPTSDGMDSYNITTKRVEGFGGTCNHVDLAFRGLANIARSKAAPSDDEMSKTAVKIGDYYYYAASPQSTCSTGEANTKAEVEDHGLITQSVKTLEAAK